MPKKDKGLERTTVDPTVATNSIHQAELLFLPEDDGYRYALVVMDIGSRAMDAQQLKTKKPTEVLKTFRAI